MSSAFNKRRTFFCSFKHITEVGSVVSRFVSVSTVNYYCSWTLSVKHHSRNFLCFEDRVLFFSLLSIHPDTQMLTTSYR